MYVFCLSHDPMFPFKFQIEKNSNEPSVGVVDITYILAMYTTVSTFAKDTNESK